MYTKMKYIYNLVLIMTTAVCCVSCNNEWESEQFQQLASFKAVPNDKGVTSTYVRYKPGGVVKFDLPIILSGSTMNPSKKTIHITEDPDTLNQLNIERYGTDKRNDKIKYWQLDKQYYTFPKTVEIPAGECTTMLPIEFTLGGTNGTNSLNMTDKWILPLTIEDDPSYDYQGNPRKHYRKALLNIIPFNDYSGTYSGTKFMIYFDDKDKKNPMTMNEYKTYVQDDKTIFVYAGLRDVDYIDRESYKVFIQFTDEQFDARKYKLKIWSDNAEKNGFKQIGDAFYMIEKKDDPQKPYLKHIYITLWLSYEFNDYTTSPGQKLNYLIEGTLAQQRDLNTLIPDEDQQIEWD